MSEEEKNIDDKKALMEKLLMTLIEREGSDLHVLGNDKPRARIHGELVEIAEEKIDTQTMGQALLSIMPPKAKAQLEENDYADFAYSIGESARFRANVFRHIGGLGGIFRSIPTSALTLEQLNLPPIVKKLCMQKQGLVLVTGKTGSGKSTTLAAMIDYVNKEKKGHILTIEDPIEFTHENRQCLMSQRQIGSHTHSFAHALHSALREDPDVILVGEMRDYETMSIAVTAAETGIVVMGTLHTNGAAQTVDRIVNTFPADKQGQIRSMLSTSLKGVISQQLMKKVGGGRVAALEILVNNSAVGNLVRQGKLDQLENTMQAGAEHGMMTMDTSLRKLIEEGSITGEDAYAVANNKSRFEQYLR